jgi:molybdopterin synthase catalytic subunit
MNVRVLPFGVLKDWLGASTSSVDLPEGSTVANLLSRLGNERTTPLLRGIAVGVNAEYATASHVLHDGDEVALLPPVSGGAPAAGDPASQQELVSVSLTRERIPVEELVADASAPEDGAVVVFDGRVRNHSRGRTTLYLDYEGYEEMALRQLRELGVQARARFGVNRVTIVHRLGHHEIGESSVLIVVTSGHRVQAFEACRWIIDTLKQTVPIWKRETFADGAVWADGEPFPAALSIDAGEPKSNA